MYKYSNQNKMGFSLIELSIVILIIGILVFGITQGSALMSKSKLSSARSLTHSSPAASIQDMIAWYETSLETSFNSSQQEDGTTIAVANGASWFDNSVNRNNNAGAVTGAVKYMENVINGLPVVRFPGTVLAVDNSIAFNSLSLSQKYYTIFIVESRSAATGDILSLGGTGAANTIGYSATGTLGSATIGSVTVPDFSSAQVRVNTFVSDATSKRAYVNGVVGGTTGAAGVITATATGLIGKSSAVFKGDVAEIIIYNRGLNVDDRNAVQEYLGKKYSIKMTVSST